jgi:hypothetical protein
METKLGWTLMGKVPQLQHKNVNITVVSMLSQKTSSVDDMDNLDHKEINKKIRHLQSVREHLRRRFRIEHLGQLREQTQRCRKYKPLAVGDIARIKTGSSELTRPVQRLYNLELGDQEQCFPQEKTDSVIRTQKGRKITPPEHLTYF